MRQERPRTAHNDRARATRAKNAGPRFETLQQAIRELERQGAITAHEYPDSNGKTSFAVMRIDKSDGKKTFRPLAKVARGWRFGDPSGKLPLYCLPDIEQGAGRVYVCEGEKAADALREIGLNATTSAHGSKSAGKTDWKPLRGRDVVILPDNDQAGRQYAEAVAGLIGACQVVELPNLPAGGDAVEFLEARDCIDPERIRAEIEALASATEPTASEQAGEFEDDQDQAKAGHQVDTLTDTGNAQRLMRLHGKDLCFVAESKEWLVWNGRYWEADTKNAALQKTADVSADIRREAFEMNVASEEGQKRQERFIRFANQSLEGRRRREILNLAKAEPGATVSVGDFDRNPWLLNCANGTLDLQSGTLRAYDRADRIAKIIPVSYNPKADCTRFKRFVAEIFDGDSELVEFMQRVVGYSLTGLTVEQCIFILYGFGANGKSTLLDVVHQVLGPLALQAGIDTFTERDRGRIPEDRARLRGARFVTTSETDKGHKLDESFIKDATGGEKLAARFLHQNTFEFRPEFKLFIACNHKPKITGSDHGIWRRIRLLPFNQTFDRNKEPTLKATLEGELEGVLAWAVQGCQKWQNQGLGLPHVVKAATDGYRTESDLLGLFIAERCQLAAEFTATASDLYQAYKDWASVGGYRPLNQRNFGIQLKEKGLINERGTGGAKRWRGITVEDVQESFAGA